jgi:hypothetical protein
LIKKSNRESSKSLYEGLWFLALFPAVPVLMFLRVLHTKRKFLSPAEALDFLTLETRARELKSITGKTAVFSEFFKFFLCIIRVHWPQAAVSICLAFEVSKEYTNLIFCIQFQSKALRPFNRRA